MKCIFPILPLLILAGLGNLARAQVGFIQAGEAQTGKLGSSPTPPSPVSAARQPSAGGSQLQASQAPPRPAVADTRAGTAATRPQASASTIPASIAGQGGAPAVRSASNVLATTNSTPAPTLSPPAAPRASPAGAPTTTAAARAKETLDRAVSMLAQRQSVAARIRSEVQLYKQHVVGSGTYIQGPPQPGTWRLEMRMQIEDAATSLVQVCDGQQLWIYRQASEQRTLERVDAAAVAAALLKSGANPNAGQPAQPVAPNLGLGFGGLPRLLKMLSESFEFQAVNEGQLEGMPAWILVGTWQPSMLAILLPDQKGAIEAGQGANLSKLSAHIPDRVTLYVGRDDLFPYRLEYHRDHPGEKEWEVVTPERRAQPIVKIEWYEVRFNLPLAREQFYFHPGDAKYEDVTKRYIEGLGLPAE